MISRVIRLRDGQGGLAAAGYEWGEFSGLRFACAALLAAGGYCALMFSIEAFREGGAAFQPISLTALCAMGVAFFWKRRFVARSLIFHLDGGMEMPQAVPGYLWRYQHIKGHHRDVNTIERIRDEEVKDGKTEVTHKTAIYFRSGNIVRVSRPLHPDMAHKVAIQLTAALQEIRDELGWQARGR
jgi:hypothetical protein